MNLEFKILMWGPEGAVKVQTVSDATLDEIVKEAVLTLRKSELNDFVGFSVMRNITVSELERRSQQLEEELSLIQSI